MKKILFIFLSSFLAHSIFAQDHGHFYVGAANQSGPLIIENAADFSTNIHYVKTLSYTNDGKFAGRYEGNITFEALSATNPLGDPTTNSAALGSWIYAQITSVDGPAGGVFSFWENGALTPTIDIPSGTTSTNLWVISNNNGAPDSDPFGHIHGRRFTATKPGIYVVGFKAVDRSVNGPGNGPLHTDSEVLNVYFQAGINIASIERTGSANRVRFGARLNKTFALEYNGDLSTTNWTTIDSIAGEDFFSVIDHTNSASHGFYRIQELNPL